MKSFINKKYFLLNIVLCALMIISVFIPYFSENGIAVFPFHSFVNLKTSIEISMLLGTSVIDAFVGYFINPLSNGEYSLHIPHFMEFLTSLVVYLTCLINIIFFIVEILRKRNFSRAHLICATITTTAFLATTITESVYYAKFAEIVISPHVGLFFAFALIVIWAVVLIANKSKDTIQPEPNEPKPHKPHKPTKSERIAELERKVEELENKD